MRSAAARVAVAALACLAVAASSPAVASVGSVPTEVRAYVTDGSLVAALDDVYGVGADGTGIDFDDTTEPGPISRVFQWTAARIAGELDGSPVELVNEWAVPISLDSNPVGVAVVWINPDGDMPELAEFQAGATAAGALSAVPDDAQLVRDLASGAWFALAGDTLTPLVAGSSGITSPTPVDAFDVALPAPAEPVAPADPTGGLGVAIVAVVLLLAVVVVALLIPGRRRRQRPPQPPV